MNNITQKIMQPGAIEFFAQDGVAFAFVDGEKLSASEWPVRIHDMIRRDMDRHPGAESALESLGIATLLEQHSQYVMCMYGDLNARPDFVDFKLNAEDTEFTSMLCGTEKCRFRGVLCHRIHAGYGELTGKEIEICRLLADGRTAHEIADILFISVNTVNTHISNILPKVGVSSSKAIAAWAATNLQKR